MNARASFSALQRGGPALGNIHLAPRVSTISSSRPSTTLARAFDLSSIPQEAVYAGGAAVAALLGLGGWTMTQLPANDGSSASSAAAVAAEEPAPLPRENAVLVLGATGRVGRRVVQKLLNSGRSVVAAVRSADKARAVMGDLGIKEGLQQDSAGILFIQPGVDVTRAETLDDPSLWRGVTQVVSLLGPSFGPQPDGTMGYNDNMTPERVEAGGWANLAAVLPKHLKKQQRETREVLDMTTEEGIAATWDIMDDVIMGGQSASRLQAMEASGAGAVQGAVWKGDLIVQGGGFCGCRTKRMDMDLSGSDGMHLRARGDGSIFKMNIKTLDQLDSPESTYQSTFDTVAGQWSDVFIPWGAFVPVKRAQSDPRGPPIDPSKISKFGLVYSRFEFNGAPNPIYTPGPWQLEIEGGLRAYKDPRPQVVLISSAGVERNAIIGNDEEARKADIPIVQLNPGGTLNWKYVAESTVRATGYPYSIIRSTGMIDSTEGSPFMLEADQGDSIAGYMGRDEVADVILAALSSPEAVNKTFEVRRSEAKPIKAGQVMGPREFQRMFLKLSLDRNRWRVGLSPFPKAVPPPPPVTEERKKEIVAQVQVVREEKEKKEDKKEEKVAVPVSAST